jgi:hypothetical protein
MSFELPIVIAAVSALATWAICYKVNKTYGKAAVVTLALAILPVSVVVVLLAAASAGPFAFIGAAILAAVLFLPAFLTSVFCAIFLSEP